MEWVMSRDSEGGETAVLENKGLACSCNIAAILGHQEVYHIQKLLCVLC
jgi:hypothetical protein